MEENTSSYVIDSAFMLAHLLPDETFDNVQEFFDRLKIEPVVLIAPYIFPFEVFNGTQTAVIRKRITPKLARKLQEQFIRITVEPQEVNLVNVSSIAEKHLLSIYDASYLYLAENLKIPLLTLDNELIKLTSRKN